jgi:hypothetical protein
MGEEKAKKQVTSNFNLSSLFVKCIPLFPLKLQSDDNYLETAE